VEEPVIAGGMRARAPGLLLVVWLAVMCLVPDPRPLGAPDWLVRMVVAVAGLGEAPARVVATLALRGGGLALLGALVVLASGARRWGRRAVGALALAPCLAVAAAWVNYGYFPVGVQLQVAVGSAVLGGMAGLALRRNLAAALAGVLATAGLVGWGTATGIRDELDTATRAAARHLLATAATVPDGDEGFAQLLAGAFAFAAEHSQAQEPLLPTRAAILALAVILGEEKLATVAGRRIDPDRVAEAEALRARITLQGRKDWPRHFWVSAGLTLLADDERSLAIGLTKELMDATPGGTGFSFADLAADAAGNRFALAATRDAAAARAMQARLAAGVRLADLCPELRDLPEGIGRDAFQADYGGLGGERTQQLVATIRARLDGCAALR
jgi:hypothetical protein